MLSLRLLVLLASKYPSLKKLYQFGLLSWLLIDHTLQKFSHVHIGVGSSQHKRVPNFQTTLMKHPHAGEERPVLSLKQMQNLFFKNHFNVVH